MIKRYIKQKIKHKLKRYSTRVSVRQVKEQHSKTKRSVKRKKENRNSLQNEATQLTRSQMVRIQVICLIMQFPRVQEVFMMIRRHQQKADKK